MHVETTSQEICRDNDLDIAVSELLGVLISLCLVHFTEYDGCWVAFFLKHEEDLFCKVSGVHEDDRLSLSSERIKYLFDKVNLSFVWALEIKLLDVIKAQLFCLNIYLVSLR